MDLDAASQLLVALAICDWVFTAVIYMASRHIPEPALVERATVSVILSLVATIAAVLGGSRLGVWHIDGPTAVVLLVVSFVLVSAPQFLWVLGLLMGKFR